jgi:TolA-binding protein
MREVQELVAQDVFMILVQQLRSQAFKIYTGNPEALGESCLGKSDIFTETFIIDFLISTPQNLIDNADKKIRNLCKKIENLNKGVANLNFVFEQQQEENYRNMQKFEEI